MKRHMFSIVEVIAVVAISATMMTMLINSIKSSKDLAIQTVCMSNIAQIRDITELYRKDHNSLPYSEIWLTDFSFAEGYLKEKNLGIFKCPGSSDEDVTSYGQLSQNTSYYFVPNGRLLEKNIDDGINYGITSDQLTQLISSENGVIYDKSADHHNGKVNIAYLFKDDDNNSTLEGFAGSITSLEDTQSLLDFDGANIVNLPEIAVTSTETASTIETSSTTDTTTVVATTTSTSSTTATTNTTDTGIVAAATSADATETPTTSADLIEDDGIVTDFEVTGDEIVLAEDAKVIYKVLGAAISYGYYDMAVTTRFQITSPEGDTTATPAFGDYGNAITGNVNNGTQQEFAPEEIYPAGTSIATEAKSWKKKSYYSDATSATDWTRHIQIKSCNNTHTMVLKNGDDVPNIDGYLDQGDVESFLGGYIDENGKVTIDENQVILLFELGVSDLSSSAADFQDLVILVTFVPAE